MKSKELQGIEKAYLFNIQSKKLSFLKRYEDEILLGIVMGMMGAIVIYLISAWLVKGL